MSQVAKQALNMALPSRSMGSMRALGAQVGGSRSVGAVGTMDFSLMGRTNLAALLLAFLLGALCIVVSLVTLRCMHGC